MASGGMVFIKYLLFFFNFIFWISGIALIAIGAVIKTKYGDFIQLSDSSITTGPIFLIIIGVIVAIVGFLGCCGAYKENYCMVTTFAVLLAIIFILEIAAGALAYAYRGKLNEYATKGIQDGVDGYRSSEEYKTVMDKLQSEFECCGVKADKGYEDYFQSDNDSFPLSCCKNQNKKGNKCPENVGEAKNKTSLLYAKGCVSGFETYLKDHLMVVGGVGVGIAFIQLIGIIFACCLMRSIKKEYEVM